MTTTTGERLVDFDRINDLKTRLSVGAVGVTSGNFRYFDNFEFRKLGKTVVEVDRAAFRQAALPLHNDPAAGGGWTKEQYDALQAVK